MSLEGALQRFGLNQSEQSVLVCLLREGAAAAASIAKRTGIKRPTVYAALENLEQRGLVSREQNRASARYRVIPKASIPAIFKRQAELDFARARELSEILEAELANLVQREQMEIAGFEIGTIESSDAVYAFLDRTLHRGDFCGIFNPQDIPDDQLKGVVARYLENTAKTMPKIRELAVSGPKTTWYRRKIRNPNHLVKELPRGTAIQSDVILVGGDIVVTNYHTNNERALRIREPQLYRTLMTMFEMLWTKTEAPESAGK